MTRSWNLELVPTFRPENSALESAVAHNFQPWTPVYCRSHCLLAHLLLGHVVPRRSEQTLFSIF